MAKRRENLEINESLLHRGKKNEVNKRWLETIGYYWSKRRQSITEQQYRWKMKNDE